MEGLESNVNTQIEHEKAELKQSLQFAYDYAQRYPEEPYQFGKHGLKITPDVMMRSALTESHLYPTLLKSAYEIAGFDINDPKSKEYINTSIKHEYEHMSVAPDAEAFYGVQFIQKGDKIVPIPFVIPGKDVTPEQLKIIAKAAKSDRSLPDMVGSGELSPKMAEILANEKSRPKKMLYLAKEFMAHIVKEAFKNI